MKKFPFFILSVLFLFLISYSYPPPTLAQDALCFWIPSDPDPDDCITGGCTGTYVPEYSCQYACESAYGTCDETGCNAGIAQVRASFLQILPPLHPLE